MHMAPHDTNVTREARKHRVPLIGMGLCVVVVLLGFIWWLTAATDGQDDRPALEATPPTATAPASN